MGEGTGQAVNTSLNSCSNLVLVIETPDHIVQHGSPQPHMLKEHLKYGLFLLRCTISIADFKELMQKSIQSYLGDTVYLVADHCNIK